MRGVGGVRKAGLQGSSLGPSPSGQGVESRDSVLREGRQGVGSSETPFVTWGCQEEAGIHGGPASLGGVQRLKGQGVFVSFLIGVLGPQPKRGMRCDGPGWTRLTEEARLLWRPLTSPSRPGPRCRFVQRARCNVTVRYGLELITGSAGLSPLWAEEHSGLF